MKAALTAAELIKGLRDEALSIRQDGDCNPQAVADLLQAAAAELEQWERRWDRLEWCHQGCRDRSDVSWHGGPSIGGSGGLFG